MLEPRGVPLRGGAVIGIRGSAEASADAGEPVTTATGLVGMISRDGSAIDRVEVGMLGERHELIGALTAVENVAVRILAASAANGSSGKSRSSRASTTAAVDLEAIEQLLAALLLPPSSWHNLIEQLSGGQQQRVAVARALVGHPPLVCLDEPTTELDATSRDAVWRAIRNAAAEGSVVIVACSDPDELARCDEIWQL